MRDFDRIVTGLFYVYWTWRVWTVLYSGYMVSQTVTAESPGEKIKHFLMMCPMMISTCLHALPLEEYPRLNFASTILSMPAQVNTVIFMHRYIEPFFNFKIVVLLRLISLASFLQTIFFIYGDFMKLE